MAAVCLDSALLRAAEVAAPRGPAADDRLDRALRQPVTLTWRNQQLRSALDRLSQAAGAPIWLDRRIDPSATVNLEATERSVAAILADLAADRQAGVSRYAGVVYFGPRTTAEELLTLCELAREEVDRMPPPQRARWLAAEPWAIPRLSEPRQLLEELVRPTGVAVVGLALLPHDLWPERRLPALARIDRVVLLLANFDLACRMSADGRGLRITPIERPVRLTRQYAVAASRQPALETLLAGMPTAGVARQRPRWIIAARAEQHEQIAALLRGSRPASRPTESAAQRPAAARRSAPAEQRFSLTIVNQPVGRVLDQLGAQLELTIEWASELAADPQRGPGALASCDVKQANLDELLAAILTPLGLKAERAGQRVQIAPSDAL